LVITTLDMRVLETNSIALGVSLRMLMEAAGKSVADTVASHVKPREAKRVVVLMGKGGNGGDALVAARYLSSWGFRVEIIPAYSSSEIDHPDTKYNYLIASRLPSIVIHQPADVEKIEGGDVIIDGLLGTGVKGVLREPIYSMVKKANETNAYLKIAIDTPSGLNPDTGEIHGIAFRADVTVTFHDIKPGLRDKPEYTGEIIVANIGIPREAQLYVGPGDILYRIPPRPRDAHKGMAGKIMVIGGSMRYTGAPALAGLAALSSASDLAYIVVPSSIRNIIASYSPELITIPYDGTHLSIEHVDVVEKYIEEIKPHVVIIGPGLGDASETLEAVREILRYLNTLKETYIVIDADALKVIDGSMRFNKKAVLTPHRGEFAKITGSRLTGELEKDAEKVADLASRLEAVVLLKAPIDIISNGVETRFNRTGNPYMTIGGTGDVLTGLTASVLAKNHDPFQSACIAAYLNGLAGDYLYKMGEKVSPLKIIEVIPTLLKNPLEMHVKTYLE